MSLYLDASRILTAPTTGGSLKSRIYKDKTLRSKPAQVFALVSEASKWSSVLKEVIEGSDILKLEKKLTPVLALLLVHDQLLSKDGIAAPKNHPLRLAIDRHKARLSSELIRARLRRGCHTLNDFKRQIENSFHSFDDSTSSVHSNANHTWPHARWVRINNLLTSLDEQLKTSFKTYARLSSVGEVLQSSIRKENECYHIDSNIPDLLCFPPHADLSCLPAYKSGAVIFQDKASCFPAYLLHHMLAETNGDIIDACAAPGNKTTHLASLFNATGPSKPHIYACERNSARAAVLSKMIERAGAQDSVTVLASQDFLELDPTDSRFQNVKGLLLDPSCSGNGIVGRDDAPTLILPDANAQNSQTRDKKRGRKRKRMSAPSPKEEEETDSQENSETNLSERLRNLSEFQLRVVLHAFSFPQAQAVTYSTCSNHYEEDENVVLKALASDVARKRGWRILNKKDQAAGLRDWSLRGCGEEDGMKEVLDGCIRCVKGTEEGTMGFFLAAFVRQSFNADTEQDENEWNGFEDD